MLLRIRNSLKSCVYPQGNVHTRYGAYVGWSFISNFAVSVETVLSTHSMLSAVGVASNELTVSTNYIGKDIIGQVGGMLYINHIGHKADKEPKKFIRYSMGIQQLSILAECATPLLSQQYFLPTAAIANMGKNISFTGFGAINATIIPKLAIDGNIGEIYAKLTVVNTLGSTLGMGVGLAITAYIPDHGTRLALMPLLGLIRYYSYTRSIEGLI